MAEGCGIARDIPSDGILWWMTKSTLDVVSLVALQPSDSVGDTPKVAIYPAIVPLPVQALEAGHGGQVCSIRSVSEQIG